MQTYKAIGIMSGTSLDGLDIVLCKFSFSKTWHFEIEHFSTVEYSAEWHKKLESAPILHGLELSLLHKEFGKFIGDSVNEFLKTIGSKIDLIASHGHTVFHQPDKRLTLQIGDGQEIATATGIKTICDFRSKDIALGGQGAPLVPIGDKLLFSEYDYCLNIGGFANVSFTENENRLAFDICPANIILNYLANKSGHAFDNNGALGTLGNINSELLQQLNSIEYYHKNYPKSLGKEWLESTFIPILNSSEISLHNKLRTVYEHLAIQISSVLNSKKQCKTLITGGGAYNKLLMNLIKHKTKSELIIPDLKIVEYKEALIFALLGILRDINQINCLSSATGAKCDSSTGIIYLP